MGNNMMLMKLSVALSWSAIFAYAPIRSCSNLVNKVACVDMWTVVDCRIDQTRLWYFVHYCVMHTPKCPSSVIRQLTF